MDERMTLEMVRDWLLARTRDGQMQRSVFTSDYQLRQMADAITAHLTQPAQAVDVCGIQWTRINTPGLAGARQWECAKCGYSGGHDAHPGCPSTRAIGNAQAEGK